MIVSIVLTNIRIKFRYRFGDTLYRLKSRIFSPIVYLEAFE